MGAFVVTPRHIMELAALAVSDTLGGGQAVPADSVKSFCGEDSVPLSS